MTDEGQFGVQEALVELRMQGVIDADYAECVSLSDATDRPVVAVGRGNRPEFVVKLDQPGIVWAAARFHEAYRSLSLVPALRYVDPIYRFLVYAWTPGTLTDEMEVPVDKARTLVSLARELLCHYIPAETSIACRMEDLYGSEVEESHGQTWQEVLDSDLSARHETLSDHLPRGAAALVQRLAASPSRRGEGPLYLLHGDFGFHNFVFQSDHLSAVIDPWPMAGEPIYDLAFAFVSWPSDLTLETILPAVEALEQSGLWRPPPRRRRRILIEEVVIALYLRIGTTLIWHPSPEDVPAYLEAWTYWTDLLRLA